MKLLENLDYIDDVEYVAGLELPWEKLADSSVLITGATGLIGSFLVDVIMKKNANGLNCRVYAVSRKVESAKERFAPYWDKDEFYYISHDINTPMPEKKEIANKGIEVSFAKEGVGYVLHLASNTHPMQYSTDPIGTITANIFGISYMLDFAKMCNSKRCAFASSNEIYGENRGDTELFTEDYCGYIDCNTMRAGYPESKRCGEALCQAYIKQNDMDIVIPRLTRSYGPTMLMSDTKAISQFIRKAIAGEDIVLKSAGTQFYSYTYMADAVSGLLYVLLLGECGMAYNIADEASDIMLKDLAGLIANGCDRKVVFEIPDAVESAGYSKATKARLDGSKLKNLGWQPRFDIEAGIKKTLDIFKAI